MFILKNLVNPVQLTCDLSGALPGCERDRLPKSNRHRPGLDEPLSSLFHLKQSSQHHRHDRHLQLRGQ